jgi:peptidyl-prolyl cis-trans isomerase SurA
MNKYFFLIVISFALSKCINAQTIFTCGNSATTKADFLRAFNKNKTTIPNKKQALKEYLDLYTNFKLKVKAAAEIGIDTLPQIKFDINNFRGQVINNYLNDEYGLKLLVTEAAQRAQKDIEMQYFFVPIKQVTADSASFYKTKAEAIANNVAKAANQITDKEKLKGIALSNSSNEQKVKFTEAGFITVFNTDYNFENAIYETKIGATSAPVFTSKGWFVFKPVATRAAVGKWNIAQILLAFPPNVTQEAKQNLYKKADSIYSLLQAGLAFADAASKFSDDRTSYQNGGVVPEFGSGKYKASFEEKVFALKNDNDISKPFESDYGIHIVKRISQKPVTTDITDENFLANIKQQVLQDARIAKERVLFAQSIKEKTGFKQLNKNESFFYKAVDSFAKNDNWNYNAFNLKNKQTLGTFNDSKKITLEDGLHFLQNYYSNPERQSQTKPQLLQSFYDYSVLDYYSANLEKYNPEFKYQMQEFKEGNMLFEIMERNVWSKSSLDSLALKQFYVANNTMYKWAESADVLVFNCQSEKDAKLIADSLTLGKNWKSFINTEDNKVQADSGRYELSLLNAYDPIIKKANTFSPIIKNTDGTATFVKYLKFYEAGSIRSFNDAKGLVINEYQNELEKKWIAELKVKYPVKYNDAVVKEIME